MRKTATPKLIPVSPEEACLLRVGLGHTETWQEAGAPCRRGEALPAVILQSILKNRCPPPDEFDIHGKVMAVSLQWLTERICISEAS